MIKSYIPDHFFLADHPGIHDFVQTYLQNRDTDHFAIVCERKEDVTTLRDAIVTEIQSQSDNPENIIAGISIYTVDRLAQKIAQHVAVLPPDSVPFSIPTVLSQPYLDITTQEKCVAMILHCFGYHESDVKPLAKQLLTILDISFPQDTNFFQIMEEFFLVKKGAEKPTFPVTSFKKILGAFQYAQLILGKYSRLQNFMSEFFRPLANEFFREDVILPQQLRQTHFLWFCAPEYVDSQKLRNIKPGNFQKKDVDDLFARFSQCISGEIYHCQTKIPMDTDPVSVEHITFQETSCRREFLENCLATQEKFKNEKNTQLILGDISWESFPDIWPDGSGKYKITQQEIARFLSDKNRNNLEENTKEFLQKNWDEFLEIFEIISDANTDDGSNSLNSLNFILKSYDLPVLQMNFEHISHLFSHSIQNGDVTLGHFSVPDLKDLPKALSFLPTHSDCKKLVCFGPFHKPSQPTFFVRMMNQVLIFLMSKGVDVELPATADAYNGFWKSLVRRNIPMTVLLAEREDKLRLPEYVPKEIKTKFSSQIIEKLSASHVRTLFHHAPLVLPHWRELTENFKKISVTKFEDYVHCPHAFYLKHILEIRPENRDPLGEDNLWIGITAHSLCEELLGELYQTHKSDHVQQILKEHLPVIFEKLRQENIFLSDKADSWTEITDKISDPHFSQALKKIISKMFLSAQDILHWNFFQRRRNLEVLKRIFLKFLHTLYDDCTNPQKKRVAALREVPLEFRIFQETWTMRIDRIDVNDNGLEVIDYKSSKISPTGNNQLTISPTNARKNIQTRLSVQGAFYSHAVEKFLAQEFENENTPGIVAQFSIYNLKNIDPTTNPKLEYFFAEAAEVQRIEEYEPFVKDLSQGFFEPRPLQEEKTCQMCSFKAVCPRWS